MQLTAFTGLWSLTRRIEDHRAGQTGHFSGTARLAPVPGGLAYVEEGRLQLGAAAPIAASRRYFWREAAGRIEIDFADGRYFHGFSTEAERPEAEHDCAPDQYRVRYDFTNWPDWRAEWQVSGPRKEYAMVSDYRPSGRAA